ARARPRAAHHGSARGYGGAREQPRQGKYLYTRDTGREEGARAVRGGAMSKILIVEDEPDMVLGLKDNFEFEGYEVLTAADGVAGLERARGAKPDLVILDIMLPKLSGLEVCKTLRGEGFEAPIIMLTARGEETDKVVARALGADASVTKPFSIRELLARVRAILRRTEGRKQRLARY